MKQQPLWKEYFHFSVKERLGITVLLLLTIVCIIVPSVYEHYNPTEMKPDTAFQAAVRAFVMSGNKITASKVAAVNRFNFDPNTVTQQQWKQLGVDDHYIRTISNYLAKGGRFRRKEDLQRIYGFPFLLYQQLAPYIYIRDTGISGRPVRKAVMIDINMADSAAWEALPGIGPVLAARIVRFREKLGGFYSVAQVAETYGLPDSTFNKIQPSLRLHKVSLKKLDINHMDEKTLAEHPYIRYKLAKLIVLYRSNNGPFSQPEQLLGIPLVDDSIYRKIEHYIKTENSPL